MVEELAIRVVMTFTLRYKTRVHAHDCSGDRSHATIELEGETPNETATQIGFVKLLAPGTDMGATVTVERIVKETSNRSIGVEHEVLANEAT